MCREFGSQLPVPPPSSRRDRSGSNLSNTDTNTAALISTQLSLAETGGNSGAATPHTGATTPATHSAAAQSHANSIPLGTTLDPWPTLLSTVSKVLVASMSRH